MPDITARLGMFAPRHIENFFAKVAEGEQGCWIWTAAVNGEGYGRFGTWLGGRTYVWLAHRWAYEFIVGPIAPGLHLDHLCRVRECVNPAHLEPVTPRVNVLRSDSLSARQARQTHCLHGHSLSGDNLYVKRNARGSAIRHCRECRRRRMRDFKARHQADAARPHSS